MHPPPTLKIHEIFFSLQGEGLRQGEPTLFVRFSGCDLKCIFCDTREAWESGKDMTAHRVLEKVQRLHARHPTAWVCLTGGEPLQQDVTELAEKLKEAGFRIQVETNGIRYRRLPVDWYTVSPKPPRYFFRPEYKEEAMEIKLVVTRDLDGKVLGRLRRAFPEKTPILLQPLSNTKTGAQRGRRLIEEATKAGMGNIRLSLQLHKIFGWR